MKEKLKKMMYIATPVCLVLLLVLNIFTMTRVKALENGTEVEETEDVAQENDVTIGGEYVIKATTEISDAYKSGDTSKLSDTDKETLDMAEKVLDEIITDGMSDYEKELAVYKWMCANIGFDDGSLTVIPDDDDPVVDNPHGVLQTKKAVCVGYATTFRLFMQMMDIDCMVVHDSYLSHSWDLVKLDGQWYHTDVFSDAPGGSCAHFNLNDSTMSNSQEWNTEFFPAADGYKYNYAYINRTECKDIYTIPEQIRAALDSKASVVSFSLGSDIGNDTSVILDNMMNQIDSVVLTSYSGTYITWDWLAADDENVFCVYIGYETDGSDTDDGDITEEQQQKIDNAVSGAFGGLASEVLGSGEAIIGGSCDTTVIN
jgi:hypothetical protein